MKRPIYVTIDSNTYSTMISSDEEIHSMLNVLSTFTRLKKSYEAEADGDEEKFVPSLTLSNKPPKFI